MSRRAASGTGACPGYTVNAVIATGSCWGVLTVLDPARGVDDLDGALAQSMLAVRPTGEPDGSAGPLRAVSSVEAFGPLAEGEALRAWTESTGWKGLWWTRGRVDGESLMLGCDGLPTIVEFVRLLESRSGRAPA
jgi:hypothetical protein